MRILTLLIVLLFSVLVAWGCGDDGAPPVDGGLDAAQDVVAGSEAAPDGPELDQAGEAASEDTGLPEGDTGAPDSE